jgi:hypothetical protein
VEGRDQQTLAGALREILEDAMDPGEHSYMSSVKGERALYQFRTTGRVLWSERNPWSTQEIMLLTRASLLGGQALICPKCMPRKE